MSLLRKALLVNASAFICLVFGMIQNVIFARVLGPTGIGQYAVVNSMMMLVTQLCCFGFPMSFLYYSQNDPGNMKRYLMNSIYATLIMGLVGGTALSVLIVWKTSYFGTLSFLTLLLIAIYVPVVLERVVSRNYLLIEIQAWRLSIKSIIAIMGSLALTGLFYVLGILTVSNAIISFIFAAFLRWALGWFWMKKALTFSIKPEWPIIHKLGKMGIRQSWADLMVLVNAQISVMVVRYLLHDFASVGYFDRGLRIAMLAVTAGQSVIPLLFSRWAAISEDKLSKHVEKVVRFSLTVGFVMIVGIIATGKWTILILYGREFLPAVKPMIILVPGTVLYLLSSSLMQLLGARGSPEYSAILLVGATLINAVLAWVLIPTAGITGAALASTVGNVVLVTSLFAAVRYKYKIKMRNCIILTVDDIRLIKMSLLGRGKERVL